MLLNLLFVEFPRRLIPYRNFLNLQFLIILSVELDKKIPLGFLSEKKLVQKKILLNQIISVHHPIRILNEKYITQMHEKNLRVLTYTVNDLKTVKQLRVMGVDGIFTDDEQLFGMRSLNK